MDLRCPHRKQGVLIRPSVTEGLVEIACPSRWCGKRAGVVVLHRFSTRTGELVSTVRYRQPNGINGEEHNDAARNITAVRASGHQAS